MEPINFFADCDNTELITLWQAYEAGDFTSKNTPFRPYLDKYANTPSKAPLILCEIDFLRTCAKRFYEKTFNELIE